MLCNLSMLEAKNIFLSFTIYMKISLARNYKKQPLPRTLIYNPEGTSIFRMYKTKNGPKRPVAIMHTDKLEKDGKDFFYLSFLLAVDKHQGYGTDFLNFSKEYSKKIGCEGRVLVDAASTVYDLDTPPHIFYRKNGFTSHEKDRIMKIDRYIKKNKQLPASTEALEMFYDPDYKEPKQSLLRKIINTIKSWF